MAERTRAVIGGFGRHLAVRGQRGGSVSAVDRTQNILRTFYLSYSAAIGQVDRRANRSLRTEAHLQIAGLFAGIGGLEVGLAEAGHRAALFCEISPIARAVLAAQFPGVPCEPDVLTLAALPDEIDLLVGGFPCQDLSQAGLTAGIGGARSGLVGRVFDFLDQRPVPWVLLENVSFMLQLDRGRALATLVEAFEERGYRWACRVVNSLAFLPQRRERVLFLATTTDIDPADVLLSRKNRRKTGT